MTLHNEQDAIKQAVEVGWKPNGLEIGEIESFTSTAFYFVPLWDGKIRDPRPTRFDFLEAFATLAFWQALGKAQGWRASVDEDGYRNFEPSSFQYRIGIPEWQYHALRYFETLLSRGDMQKFWEELP